MENIEVVLAIKDLNVSGQLNSLAELKKAQKKNEIDFDFVILYGDTNEYLTSYKNKYYFSSIEFLGRNLKTSSSPVFRNNFFSCNSTRIIEKFHHTHYNEGFYIDIHDSEGVGRKFNFYKGIKNDELKGILDLLNLMMYLDNSKVRSWREYDLHQNLRYIEWKLECIKQEISESSEILSRQRKTKEDISALQDNLRWISSVLNERYDHYDFSKFYEEFSFNHTASHRNDIKFRINHLSRGKYYKGKNYPK